MELKPYLYKLLPEFEETGAFGVLEGKYELESFSKGPRVFMLADSIHFKLSLTNVGDIVLLTGTVEAEVFAECDRCLEPLKQEIVGEVKSSIVFDAALLKDDKEDDEYCVPEGPEACIDLAPLLYAALVFALPLVMLCTEDCAGICPSCGVNRNRQSCSCASDAIDSSHPFAVLKDLL